MGVREFRQCRCAQCSPNARAAQPNARAAQPAAIVPSGGGVGAVHKRTSVAAPSAAAASVAP